MPDPAPVIQVILPSSIGLASISFRCICLGELVSVTAHRIGQLAFSRQAGAFPQRVPIQSFFTSTIAETAKGTARNTPMKPNSSPKTTMPTARAPVAATRALLDLRRDDVSSSC
jgi:hypothetical protein